MLARLLLFVWPKDRPDLRVRVALAGLVLVAAKLVTVATPLAYKAAVDWFTGGATGAAVDAAQVLTIVPVALIVAYGLGRVLMMLFTQIRDVLFTRVGQNAVRALSNQAFEHLHRMSLRFHLERKTGGLSRVVERGRQAVDLIIRMGVLNSLPTVLDGTDSRNRFPAVAANVTVPFWPDANVEETAPPSTMSSAGARSVTVSTFTDVTPVYVLYGSRVTV